ncbi:MAG: rRNA maturation RNase YbeY [Bacillota bacterium]|nr:rRNA maturation RNase YbeY [Bacillota bacterium]
MELSFDYGPYPSYDGLGDRYLSLLEECFLTLGVKENYFVDVSLVDEETIQQINREYRHIDRVTDVISFAFNDDKSELSLIKGDAPRALGEIFICLPRALEQAKEIGNSEERELRFLFIHGLLHLLGYDHMKKEDEEVMFPLQEKILSQEESKWKKKS